MDKKTIKIIKITSIIFSIIGTIGSAWSESKENEFTLQKMVKEHFEKGE